MIVEKNDKINTNDNWKMCENYYNIRTFYKHVSKKSCKNCKI